MRKSPVSAKKLGIARRYTVREMDGLTIRKARPGDTNRIAQIMHGEPGQEAVALLRGEQNARTLGMALVRLPKSPQGWEHTVVVELDRQVVGIMQAGITPPRYRLTPRMAYLTFHVLGAIGTVRVLPRLRSRLRVQPKIPSGSYHISEMDVDPAFRNRGIGSALLGHAEDAARSGGIKLMSLTTNTVNPARSLYERYGFQVVETRTDRDFERYTGIRGRHLMVKELM